MNLRDLPSNPQDQDVRMDHPNYGRWLRLMQAHPLPEPVIEGQLETIPTFGNVTIRWRGAVNPNPLSRLNNDLLLQLRHEINRWYDLGQFVVDTDISSDTELRQLIDSIEVGWQASRPAMPHGAPRPPLDINTQGIQGIF